jgi:Adenylate and Guanylate cyclase catalytic domain
VLSADLVDFTHCSERVNPAAVVEVLNELFSAFDELGRHHGLEKIKTVGDAYMVAGGSPNLGPSTPKQWPTSHSPCATRWPTIRTPAASSSASHRHRHRTVVAAHRTAKFSYDLWGDTVNTASRMESDGTAGLLIGAVPWTLRSHLANLLPQRKGARMNLTSGGCRSLFNLAVVRATIENGPFSWPGRWLTKLSRHVFDRARRPKASPMLDG